MAAPKNSRMAKLRGAQSRLHDALEALSNLKVQSLGPSVLAELSHTLTLLDEAEELLDDALEMGV